MRYRDETLDNCTHYEGKHGYALVDRAWLDSLIAENERLRGWYSQIFQAVWLASEDEVEFGGESATELCREAAQNALASIKLRERKN